MAFFISILEPISKLSPVGHGLLVICAAALLGLTLGSVRIGGVKLGVAGMLFSGLFFGHIGWKPDSHVLHFLKEFGLILFVFTVGMQVGPGFFNALKRDGRRLMVISTCVVLLGGAIAWGGGRLLRLPIEEWSGVLAGAVTNTPSLGAAQETLAQSGKPAETLRTVTLAYAAAYPLGVAGIILALVLLRAWFRIDPKAEAARLDAEARQGMQPLERMNLVVTNRNLDGVALREVPGLRETGVIISRIRRQNESEVHVVGGETVLHLGDVVLAVGTPAEMRRFSLVLGDAVAEDLMKAPGDVIWRRIVLTNKRFVGKTMGETGLHHVYDVTVTRISRADMVMTAVPEVRLQYGDMLQVVGTEEAIDRCAKALGNSVRQLNETNFAALFAGIALGLLLGLFPWNVPGLPVPVRLGLAGGPLLVAILLSRLGRIGPLVLHMPLNANTAFREMGMILFLGCVGLDAGGDFAATVFGPQGLAWMGLGLAVTMVPLLIVGSIAIKVLRMNYLTVCGVLAGSMTDPPALAFATGMAKSDHPSVSYATVYPVTMLLRILLAQLAVVLLAQ